MTEPIFTDDRLQRIRETADRGSSSHVLRLEHLGVSHEPPLLPGVEHADQRFGCPAEAELAAIRNELSAEIGTAAATARATSSASATGCAPCTSRLRSSTRPASSACADVQVLGCFSA